jgi:hypothetical protein
MQYPSEYWWVHLICAVAFDALVYFMVKRSHQTREYLSGFATAAEHHNSWTERVVVTRTYTDSNGKQHTRTEVRHVYHPDRWLIYYNTGRSEDTSRSLYNAVTARWESPVQHINPFHMNCVAGGGGQRYDWDHIQDHAYTTTYRGWYTNYILNSNSIFKAEKISAAQVRDLGLIDYPTRSTYDNPFGDDIDCILASPKLQRKIPFEWMRGINLFNAFFGQSNQIHVFVLLYPASLGLQTAVHQRSHWRGGNKNEFTVCLGVELAENDGLTVRWCEAFSWCDIPQMESAVESWFLEHRTLDFTALAEWLTDNVSLWKRKEFKDFEYLKSRIPAGRSALIGLVTVILCAIEIYFTIYGAQPLS